MMEVLAITKEGAHRAAKDGYVEAQRILGEGKSVVITVKEQEDDRSLQQLRFYWGAVLKEISEQVVLAGERWEPEAWHNLLKRKFLGYEINKERVAGSKRTRVVRRLARTPKKVKPLTTYIEQVQAYAITELGVQFSEMQS